MNTENHTQPSLDQVMKGVEIVRQLLVANKYPHMRDFFELVEVGEVEAALVGGVRVLSEMGVGVPNHVRLHAEELDRIEKQRIAEQTRRIHDRYKNQPPA